MTQIPSTDIPRAPTMAHRAFPIMQVRPETQTEMPVRWSDWKRIRHAVDKIKDVVPRLRDDNVTWAVGFLGLGTSFLLGLIPALNAQSSPATWALAFYIGGGLVCGAAAACTCWFGKRRQPVEQVVDDVLRQIDEIASWYYPPSLPSPKPEESPDG